MKTIKYILYALTATFVLASCSDDIKYTPGEGEDTDCYGVYFPSQENAASGAYTLTRLLYMNTKGAPSGLTNAFIDYIYSPEGSAIIEKSGYIPTGRK